MSSMIRFATVTGFVLVLCLMAVPTGWAWDVVMQDGWKDQWELNKIKEDNYAVYYDGQWRWKSGRQWKTGKAAAAYIKEGTSMCLSAFYDDGDTVYNLIYPYTAWYNDRAVYRWYGVRHWVRDTQYSDNIYFDVTEGQVYYFTNIRKTGRTKPPPARRLSSTLEALNPFRLKAPREILFSPLQSDESTLRLGALVPLTGDLASFGESEAAAVSLAVEQINETFAEQGLDRRVEVTIRDTQTSPIAAAERLREFKQAGINVVLGPAASETAYMLLPHANDNDMLLLSGSSTAIDLALAGDNLMRLMPDDTHQARALADKLEKDGIRELVVVTRTDIYGGGFSDSLVGQFQGRGGVVAGTYPLPPKISLVDSVLQSVDQEVAERVAAVGADKVGVVIILFDEGIEVLKRAAGYESLGQVRWYGTDGLAQSQNLLADEAAAAFAVKTQFLCTTCAQPTNEKSTAVQAELATRLGFAPNTMAMNLYDATFLATRALLRTDDSDIAAVRQAIRFESEIYSGATSPIVFNYADDRGQGNYDYWKLTGTGGQFQWTYESTWQWAPPVEVLRWLEY